MQTEHIVVAYHGCNRALKEQILKNQNRLKSKKELNPKKNKGLWLGSGIYFFEDNLKAAQKWARNHHKNNPGVLGAIIDLGDCLDLAALDGTSLLEEAYRFLSIVGKDKEILRSENKDEIRRELDHVVIDKACDFHVFSGRYFDTVRCPFVWGKNVGELAKLEPLSFQTDTHTEICVRNPAQILFYFDPDKEAPLFDVQIASHMKSLVRPLYKEQKKSK